MNLEKHDCTKIGDVIDNFVYSIRIRLTTLSREEVVRRIEYSKKYVSIKK